MFSLWATHSCQVCRGLGIDPTGVETARMLRRLCRARSGHVYALETLLWCLMTIGVPLYRV